MEKQKAFKKIILLLLTATVMILTDQLSKWWAVQFSYSQLNYGGVFGIGQGWGWLMVISFLLLCITIYVVTRKNIVGMELIAWGVIIGAGFSNLIDRFLWGGVWDWIVYPVVNVVGNVADVYLGIGFILLLYFEFKKQKHI